MDQISFAEAEYTQKRRTTQAENRADTVVLSSTLRFLNGSIDDEIRQSRGDYRGSW